MALLVLILFFVLLFLLSFNLFKKDYLSPSFLLICLFLVSSIFGIIGNVKWKVELNVYSLLVVGAGVLFILLGEIFIRATLRGGRIYVISRKSVKNYHYKISIKLFVVLFLCQIVIFYLYYRRMIAIASSIGYSGSGLIQFIRVATVNENIKVGTFFSVFLGLIYAVAYVYLYIFINNFPQEDRIRYFLKNIYLLLPSIILFLTNILSGARNGIIITLSVLGVFVLDKIRRSEKSFNFAKFFIIGAAAIIGFFFVFSKMGELTGKMNSGNSVDTIYVYAGSSILGFSEWMNNPTHSSLFGQESFWGIRYLLNKFFPFIECSEEFLPGVTFPNGTSTNIFTGFKSYYADFGFAGTLIVCFFIGLLMSLFYIKTFKKNNITTTILYGFFFSCFAKLLFAASITSELFTSSQIFGCMWIILVSKVVVRKKNVIVNFKDKLMIGTTNQVEPQL